eukprot:4507251-Amphidinium_carterae.1
MNESELFCSYHITTIATMVANVHNTVARAKVFVGETLDCMAQPSNNRLACALHGGGWLWGL